jgi:hypothetical protein
VRVLPQHPDFLALDRGHVQPVAFVGVSPARRK